MSGDKMYLKTRAATFLIVFVSFSLNAEKSENFKHGYLLYDKNKIVDGEIAEIDESHYFIRNKKIGKKISREKVDKVINSEYYDLINSSSPSKATWESIYLFSSGNKYQYEASEMFPNEEKFTFYSKISLAVLTLFFYHSALEKNEQLSKSYLGINSDSKSESFRREYQRFQVSLFLTSIVFIGSGVLAYFRFDRDSNFQQLNTKERVLVPIEDLAFYRINQNEGINFSFGIKKSF
ncbi:hypothetical protein EHQ46_05950 [Leptospira yanagawae]|uniref:DUF5683 domain-containing protein n=1 Tax=Leptospira yanagawae TaxID=293069 RepID=A0ABY2M556_9LEPT|nr:hypothetical protein [Leptospira yanagawae]TGL23058.1 hypothetical protein EHQ46_05950 [Leptospira yanagawae]